MYSLLARFSASRRVKKVSRAAQAKVIFLDEIRTYVVEWVDAIGLLISHGHRLYAVARLQRPTEEDLLFSLPFSALRAAFVSWRPTQRLTRSIFYNVYRLPDGAVFFTFGRQMGIWRAGEITWISGALRPMRCLRGSIAMEPNGTLYLGEYDRNRERRSVRIYCLPAGSTTMEVAHEFGAGAVRHVHGLYRQPNTHHIWCTTGDIGQECRILVTEDRFKTLHTIGMGDESWRAVSLSFLGSTIVYGTDAEFVSNHIYALDTKNADRRCLSEVDGPVYYSSPLGPHLLFSVTAEGCPGQPLNQASLWMVTENLDVSRIVSYRKDAWPRPFMFGTIHFSLGPGESRQPQAYAFLHGLAARDGHSMSVTVERA